MLKNYLTIALRTLRKHPGYTAINVVGLALGIACCLLVARYVEEELSYDRHHVHAEQVVRLAMETESSNRRFQYPSVGGGWAEALRRDLPGVAAAARLNKPFGGPVYLVKDDERFAEENLFWADSTLFDVLTFPFLEGDPATALQNPFSLVVTRASAQKYFGTTAVVGRTLGIEFGGEVVDLEITGVIENPPATSHLHPDFLGALSTLRVQLGDNANNFLNNFTFTAFYTYLRLREDYPVDAFEAQLPTLFEKYTTDEDRRFVQALFAQPLTDIHLHSRLLNEIETNGNMAYVYVFSAIALLTLLIACVNFMNLATARSAGRAREVGMRKVLGAERPDLIRQFLGESVLMALAATLLAVVFAEAALPSFNALAGKDLAIGYLDHAWVLPGLLGLALVVGIVAGSYPALFLSAFQPLTVLKGAFDPKGGGTTLRKALVVGQFAITIVFLVGSFVVYRQLDFIQHAPAGFERAHRVVIPLPVPNNDGRRERTAELLKREYARTPGVRQVAAATSVPGQLRGINRVRTPGMPAGEYQETVTVAIDHDYVPTMGIEVLAGRPFDPALATDSTEAFMLNEAAAALLDLPEPVGAAIEWRAGLQDNPNTEVIQGTVIGVYRNLHFEPMYREIAPMLFRVNPAGFFNLVAELDPDAMPATLGRMEQTWREVVPDRPFAYSFLDDDLAEIYQSEHNLGRVVRYVTFLAIFIACLGLFGLASFTAAQRTREIGVRKTLGATVPGIVFMLSREVTLLVGLAFVVAAPVAWFAAHQWLGTFVYHVAVSPLWFVLAGLAALVIAWLTVGYQSVKAAMINPVDALRYE